MISTLSVKSYFQVPTEHLKHSDRIKKNTHNPILVVIISGAMHDVTLWYLTYWRQKKKKKKKNFIFFIT